MPWLSRSHLLINLQHTLKHAIGPQKSLFSFIGHKRVHTKAKYPQKSDASDTCCFYFNSTFCSSLLIWMLYKDTLDDSLFPFCSCMQPKGRTKLWFISRVSHLALSSVTAALLLVSGYKRQYECGLADCWKLPHTELKPLNHVLVHST